MSEIPELINGIDVRALRLEGEPVRTLQQLQQEFPWVDWTSPQRVTVLPFTDTPHYICKVCLVNYALAVEDIPNLPTDPRVIHEHIRTEHL